MALKVESSKWYEKQPLPVIENDQVKLMWDNTIITDRRIQHNRPDITLALKDKQQWIIEPKFCDNRGL